MATSVTTLLNGAYTGYTGSQGATGYTGSQGVVGYTGSQGASGEGLPAGGTTDQVLAKVSNTSGDVAWSSLSTVNGMPLVGPGVTDIRTSMIDLVDLIADTGQYGFVAPGGLIEMNGTDPIQGYTLVPPNRGAKVLWGTTSSGSSTVDLSTQTYAEAIIFVAMGDDSVPAAPTSSVGNTVVTVGSNTSNSVSYRYGYIASDVDVETELSGLSTSAIYHFYGVFGTGDPYVNVSAVATGSSGDPVFPTVNVTSPGCLVFGFGLIDDDINPSLDYTSDEYQLLENASYGTSGSGGTLFSIVKYSSETGAETPPIPTLSSDDAWVAITMAILPSSNRYLAQPVPAGGTTGQVLQKLSNTNYDIGWSTIAGGSGVTATKVTVYNTAGSGTFTRDANTLFAQVYCTGGGGGGGGADSDGTSMSAAGGGGGGGTAIAFYSAAQLGATASRTVGAAGSAGSTSGGNGGTGGNSTFTPTGTGAALTGNGGVGGSGTGSDYGSYNSVFNGGSGGGGSGGYIIANGMDGHAGFGYGTATSTGSVMGGNGGSSFWGGGGNAPVRNNSAGSTAGVAATTEGAGGSGAVNNNNSSGVAGGAGAPGAIVIIEYLSA